MIQGRLGRGGCVVVVPKPRDRRLGRGLCSHCEAVVQGGGGCLCFTGVTAHEGKKKDF